MDQHIVVLLLFKFREKRKEIKEVRGTENYLKTKIEDILKVQNTTKFNNEDNIETNQYLDVEETVKKQKL